MNRVLRIQLRRSAAPGAALAILLVMLIMHTSTNLEDGWLPLAFDLRAVLLFVWPLALAAGAWQARREHRAGVHDLLESTARPRWSRVLPVLAALGIAVSAAFLVAALTAVPRLVDPTSYLPATAFVVIAVGALSLMAAAWLGMALGQLLPSVVTAPALGVAGIGLLLGSSTLDEDKAEAFVAFHPSFVATNYAFHDFFTVPGRVSAAQALWWLAVASTAMVILAGRSWTRVAALLPALTLGAAAHIIVPQDSPYPGLAVDPGAQQLACAEGTPRVCVARVHAHLLPEVTPLAREGLTMLARLPDAPTAAIENVNVREASPDSHQKRTDLVEFETDLVEFEIEYDYSSNGKSISAFDTLLNILDARGNHYYSSCPGDVGADIVADRAAAYWLLGQEPESVISEQVHELWRTLDALPDEEAVDRVTALRDAKRTCSAERAHLLTGGPA